MKKKLKKLRRLAQRAGMRVERSPFTKKMFLVGGTVEFLEGTYPEVRRHLELRAARYDAILAMQLVGRCGAPN